MPPQTETHTAVVLDHLAAVGHPCQRHRRLDQFGLRRMAAVGGDEQRERRVGQPANGPQRTPAIQPEATVRVRLGQPLQRGSRDASAPPQFLHAGVRRLAPMRDDARAVVVGQPATMRKPSRTARYRPPAGSSVQSQREVSMQTGRTSTSCSLASRTTCAGT